MEKRRVYTLLVAGLLAGAAWPALLQAQTAQPAGTSASGASVATPQTPAPKPNVVFDHKTDSVKIFDLDLEDGQTFLIHIQNTCPQEFDYPYVAVARGTQAEAQAQSAKQKLSTHPITVVYDDRYGGYVFSLVRKADVAAGSKCEEAEGLTPTTFIVSVREQSWGVSFSGGFTFSGLTSPVYGLRTENNVKRIFRESDKEDDRRLGAASFVHAFHDGVAWKGLQPALAFGLGINSDNRAEYFLGAGLRLGDKATINGGLAFGSISRLPNGVTLDTPVTDDNILNNLGSQVVRRYFFALSYAFIDTRDRLKKPFAADAPTAAPGAATSAKPTSTSDTSQKIVETLAQNADTYAAIPEMKDTAICRAEVKPGDGNSLVVVLHLKDTAQLAKLPEGVAKRATEELNKRIQASITPNPPTVKQTVTFGQVCK